ncbi:MAG: tetratricopeptide repeat protein [Deltaproteobacteria bacterium]|nr:tetratricopeptide repeat protein [Deltaproteobacteria bacterium]
MANDFESTESPPEERSLDTDATTAHLDRGWDLLRRGDMMGARLSAQHILELDDESPEGYMLLGAIVAAEGDPEGALDLFGRALECDPDYVDAMLYAAEISIEPLKDFDGALRFCDDAEPLVAGSDEAVDVCLLRAEACLAGGYEQEAQAALDRLPAGPYVHPSYDLRVGRICIDLARYERAIELLERAATEELTPADAHYFLGVALEMAGRSREGVQRLLAVREADLGAADVKWSLDDEEFLTAVHSLLAQIHGPVGADVQAAPLFVLPVPSLELVVEGFDPRAPVYLATANPKVDPNADVDAEVDADAKGEAKAQKGRALASRRPQVVEGAGLVLAAVVVYKCNVERYAETPELLREELQTAIVQELAFFYGLEESDAASLFTGPSPAH